MPVYPASGSATRLTVTLSNGKESWSSTTWPQPWNVNYVSGVTRVKQNTPDYYYRLEKNLLLPVNSYTRLDKGDTPGYCMVSGHTTTPFTTGSGRYEYKFNLYVSVPFVDLSNEASIRTLLTNEEISWCQNKAKADMLEQVEGAHELLGVFLAEGHKTLNMLFDTAKRLILHAQHLLFGSLGSQYWRRYISRPGSAGKSVQRIVQDLGDKWLEAYYGWQPLVYDMKNSLEAFFEASSNLPRFKIRGYNKYVKETTRRISGTGLLNGSSGPYEYTLRTNVTYKVNVGGILDFDPYAERPAWLREFGLTPVSIPQTIWELVKFSFIVDTFINLGDTLRNLSLLTIKGHVNESFYITERFEVIQVVEDFVWLNNTTAKTHGTSFSVPRVIKFMRRSPLVYNNMHVSLQFNPNPWWVGVGNAAYIFARKGLPRGLRI